MKPQIWLPAALSVALTGAASAAPEPPPPAAPRTETPAPVRMDPVRTDSRAPEARVETPAAVGLDQPLFINGQFFQFVPGVGFVPLGVPSVQFDPRLAAASQLGLTYFPGFVPGVNTGLITAYPPIQAIGPTLPFGLPTVRYGPTPPLGARPVLPIVGVTVPPGQGPRITTRVAGSRLETRPVTVTPEEARLAGRMEELMEDRPLREGVVVTIGATGATVRYSVGEQSRTTRFPLDEIFFFQNDTLRSAETAPGVLRTGDAVMVPQPETAR